MAKNLDKEFLSDAKTEHKTQTKNTEQSEQENTFTNASANENTNANPSSRSENTEQQAPTVFNTETNKEKEELKEKFESFSKDLNFLTGAAVTEIVDDFKTKLLWLYAKKKGVEVPQEALKMDGKAKEFCSVLVDYALKNKLFSYIEKYPLIAAAGVVALTAGTSYIFIETMANANEEKETMLKKIKALEAEKKARESKEDNGTGAEVTE